MADYTGSVSLPETCGKAAGAIVVAPFTRWRGRVLNAAALAP
ncbi:hypothetical protein [Teredinibacter turnerae]|nr:hypothetical protein [Teredinibacter turnerae]